MKILLYNKTIFIYSIIIIAIIIIEKKKENVKEVSEIYFETYQKIKWFASLNPDNLEELTESELAQWISQKGEERSYDNFDNRRSCGRHDRIMRS